MDQLLREMAGTSRETKLQVMRGLTQCIGSDGRATRPFVLRLALGTEVEVPQSEVVKTILALKAKL